MPLSYWPGDLLMIFSSEFYDLWVWPVKWCSYVLWGPQYWSNSELILGLDPASKRHILCNDVSHWLGTSLETALQYGKSYLPPCTWACYLIVITYIWLLVIIWTFKILMHGSMCCIHLWSWKWNWRGTLLSKFKPLYIFLWFDILIWWLCLICKLEMPLSEK